MSADNIGLCPMCPAGTGEHLLIAGRCKFHFRNPVKPGKPKQDLILQLKELAKPVINPVSEKKKKDDATYKKLRRAFLKANGYCMIRKKGCTVIATDVHHKAGRGANYLKVETWLPACRHCHDIVTEHSAEAIEQGHSERRNKAIE